MCQPVAQKSEGNPEGNFSRSIFSFQVPIHVRHGITEAVLEGVPGGGVDVAGGSNEVGRALVGQESRLPHHGETEQRETINPNLSCCFVSLRVTTFAIKIGF